MNIIVYDTSSIYSASFLETDINLIKKIIEISSSYIFKTPEIVVDESINKLIENIEEINNAHKKNINQSASRFIFSENSEVLTSDLITSDIKEKAVNILKVRFEKIGTIIPYPKRTQKYITLRAIKRLKPFDVNGENGYRDTIIWETLKDLCKTTGKDDKIYFICNNPKDFYDIKKWKDNNTVLHKDLIDELTQIDFNPDNFICCKSLNVFSETYFKKFELISEEEKSYTDDEIIFELKSKIAKDQLKKYINKNMFSEEDFEFEVTYLHDNIDIDYIGLIDIKNISNIIKFNKDIICAEINCDVEYSLGIYIFKSDYFLDEEEIDFVEDWNKHYFRKEYSSNKEYNFKIKYDMAISKILTLEKMDD